MLSLLFIAFVHPLPYGLYTLNRIVTKLFAVIGAYCVWEENTFLAYALVLTAIVFNPIIPIHLNRNIWKYVDVIATVPFGILIFIKSEQ